MTPCRCWAKVGRGRCRAEALQDRVYCASHAASAPATVFPGARSAAKEAAAQALGVNPAQVTVTVRGRRAPGGGRKRTFSDAEILAVCREAGSIRAAARALPLAESALRRHVYRLGIIFSPPTEDAKNRRCARK